MKEEVTEETTEEVVTQQEETKQEDNKQESKEEKVFTQEDFNEALQKELKRKTKNMPSKDELKAFNEWKESQKTAEEKNAEKEQEYQKIVEERNNFERENLLLRKGVNEDDIDYVLFKVSKQTGEFEDNLAQFLMDNPKYLKNYEEPKKTIDLSGEHTDKKPDDNSFERKVMGLN